MQIVKSLLNLKYLLFLILPLVYSKNFAGIPCGKQFDRVPKIVGGVPTFLHEFPWIVSLKLKGESGKLSQHFCGGSLIHSKYVLTSAQCVFMKRNASLLTVTTGEYFLDQEELPNDSVDNEVEKIIIHPKYSFHGHQNDIALIQLKRNCFVSPSAWPACLADEELSEGNDIEVEGTVAGWGSLKEINVSDPNSGKLSNTLMRVNLPIWKNSDCQESFKRNGFGFSLKHTHLCAGSHLGQKDTCSGDSGSPLMVKRQDKNNKSNNVFEIVGITIGGRGCGRIGLPGVYIRVANYLPWIEAELSK